MAEDRGFEELLMMRGKAQEITCDECGAQPGKPCVRRAVDGGVVELRWMDHTGRYRKALNPSAGW